MKRFSIAIVVLVALLAAGYAWRARTAKGEGEHSPVKTTTVKRGSLAQAITSSGRVVSNLDVDIKCKASGEIIKLPFDISQAVHEGDLLLEIDPVNQLRAVRQSEVAVAQSQAKLAQAKQNLAVAEQALVTDRERASATLRSAEIRAQSLRDKATRRKQLLDQSLGTPEDWSLAEADAAGAVADLELARVGLEEIKTQELALDLKRQDVVLAQSALEFDQIARSNAQQMLADTKVVAPMEGVVSGLNVQRGVIISSGITNVGGGTTVMTLADLSKVFVLASVDESDIGSIAVGQAVTITADAYPTRVLSGRVVRIATRGVNVSNVVTFEVKIEVEGEDKKLLKPEMIASVRIVSNQKDDALLVPERALSRKDKKLVATVVNGKVHEDREVAVGMGDGEHYEVLSGLQEGDVVLLKDDEALSRWRAEQTPRQGPTMGPFGPMPRR